jgi:hypothetical protein
LRLQQQVFGGRGLGMSSPRNDAGFLTQQQREQLRVAVQNAETLSLASPRSPTGGTTSALLQQYELQQQERRAAAAAARAGGGGGGGGAAPVRHARRSHSGKAVKLKKGEAALDLFFKSLALACVL